MDDDLAAGAIGGILDGIGQGAKDFVNVQMARRGLDLKQQELDNDTKYKNAQVDYLEGRGQLAGAQAEAYRFNINQADKVGQNQLDTANDHVDAAHMQVQQQVGNYRTLLNQALQTPEGQNYMANSMGGATEATGMPQGEGMSATPPVQPSANGQGSSVVNTIMAGVGSNAVNGQPQYVPTSNRGAMNKITSTGMPSKRNSSLEKAMGNIDSMQIDNREDAQYAMEKYYGADWANNPEAVSFMDQKFGKSAAGAADSQNASGAQAAPQTGTNANDLVPVTGPDGNNYKVPKANLQKAIQRGYRVRKQ